MRLIDAELVLDNLSGLLESMKDYDAVKDVINNMPTAYDVDKVLEQLRDEEKLSYADFEIYAEEHGLSEDDDWNYRGLGRAVEIVKRGGTDGKTD